MGIMNSAKFRSVVEPLLNDCWDGVYDALSPEWKKVYTIKQGLKRRVHEYVALAGMPTAYEKGEGQPYTYVEGGEAYKIQFPYRSFGIAYALTQEMIEDGDHISIGSIYAEHMARSMVERSELEHVTPFNNGFTQNFIGGVPWFSAAHPHFGGGTGSNLVPNAQISVTSLYAARMLARKQKNEQNQPISSNVVRLIIPPDLRQVADVVTKSVLLPGSANNDINYIASAGEFKEVVELTRLASSTAWYVQTDVPDGLFHFPRVKPEKKMDVDSETDSAKYRNRERYAYGPAGYRCMIGCQGQ